MEWLIVSPDRLRAFMEDLMQAHVNDHAPKIVITATFTSSDAVECFKIGVKTSTFMKLANYNHLNELNNTYGG